MVDIYGISANLLEIYGYVLPISLIIYDIPLYHQNTFKWIIYNDLWYLVPLCSIITLISMIIYDHFINHIYILSMIFSYIHTYIYTYIHIYIHTYICICICICVYVYVYVYMQICIYVYMYICIYIYILYTRIYNMYIYIYILEYINIYYIQSHDTSPTPHLTCGRASFSNIFASVSVK